ncbi:hypothetical protein [Pseudoroseomonas ludipueritiae]|uniref:Uncharacterized protein n=1 Tax=Pseudoroseomonas ludipueritiae TaxID=198093 RepID=A0ABR7R108_9PROT|nr:hypothetical protein [Pseudoroseomonas ludipueritiae]MBC9175420.1 hypothetical protein [Pseudoroseomonas ludipueritiae]
MKHIAAAFALCLTAGATQAAPLRDNATGLAVDPPPGYTVKAEAPDRQHASSFSVKRAGETATGCQIGFTRVAGNARRSQPEINAMIGSAAGQEAGRATLASVYDVTESATVQLGDVSALLFLASFKRHPKLPPEALNIRTLFAILETPRGRTSIVCAAQKGEFASRRPEFEAVVRGTTPP